MCSVVLYKAEKYKVVTGAESSVGLCTIWTDPFTLADREPDIRNTFAITGSLYSREGVSIMLRNLALHPEITTVYLWGNGKLSQTAVGTKGKNIILTLWNHGKALQKDILSEIQREIDVNVLSHMFKHISFVELSNKSLDEVIQTAKEYKKGGEPYMEPTSFPDPVIEEDAPMPSERANFSVRGRTLTETWMRALDRVIRYGYLKETEVGIRQKEVVALSWTIENTDITHIEEIELPERLKSRVGIEKSVLDQYATVFLDPVKPEDVAYTYGNRLRNYRGKLDQIEEIITKLKDSKITRRAYATTFDPLVDHDNPSPPCLMSVQALIADDEKLHMIASFRSHDMFKAALPNAYGLLHVMKYISEKTSIPEGSLTIHSTSAHVYEDDFKDARDLLKCGMWGKLKLYFDENDDIDPRGIMRIETVGKKIQASLLNNDGEELHKYLGLSAREVSLHFARLGLLSRQEHMVDLSIELTKAEIAMKLQQEYIQDRPLIFDSIVIK